MVTLAEPEVEFTLAVTLTVPAAVAVRKPLLPLLLLTVALAGLETLQWADVVTVCCVPSLSEAVAANCCVCPAARFTEAGLTLIDVMTALVPVTVVFALTLPLPAVITLVPVAAIRMSPVLLTEAQEGLDVVHVTVLVRSCVLPSENVPVAVSCWLTPTGRLG